MRKPLTSEEAATSQQANTDSDVVIPQHKLTLLEALHERDARLAAIYEAVIHVMAASDLPDQLSLAAHAMRELMERLPVAFDVPIHEKASLIDRVRELERDLLRAQEKSSCRTSDGWRGTIDAPLAKLLNTVELLAKDRKRYWPSRREVALELMNELEPALGRRSPALVKPEAAAWAEIRRYFEQVSHHHHVFDSFETSPSALEEHISTVEVLLLNKLRPPTAEDFQEIDELMSQFLGVSDD